MVSCTPQMTGDQLEESHESLNNSIATEIPNLNGTSEEANLKTAEFSLGKTDEWSFGSREKQVFICDDGYYLHLLKQRGDNSYLSFAFVNTVGELSEPLAITLDFRGQFLSGNTIYGNAISWEDGNMRDLGVCKYENGALIGLSVPADNNVNYYRKTYYTEDYIYFSVFNEPIIYRMDYTGDHLVPIVRLSEQEIEIYDFAVYNNMVWYEYIDRNKSDWGEKYFASYDLATEKQQVYDNGGIGLINNNFMYYLDSESRICRFNFDTKHTELVCDDEVVTFDFFTDSILYATKDILYKFSVDGCERILSIDQLDDVNYFSAIQCQNDRIFVSANSGVYHSCLYEIDVSGNIINAFEVS